MPNSLEVCTRLNGLLDVAPFYLKGQGKRCDQGAFRSSLRRRCEGVSVDVPIENHLSPALGVLGSPAGRMVPCLRKTSFEPTEGIIRSLQAALFGLDCLGCYDSAGVNFMVGRAVRLGTLQPPAERIGEQRATLSLEVGHEIMVVPEIFCNNPRKEVPENPLTAVMDKLPGFGFALSQVEMWVGDENEYAEVGLIAPDDWHRLQGSGATFFLGERVEIV